MEISDVASIITNITIKLLTEQGAWYRMQKTSGETLPQQIPVVRCCASPWTFYVSWPEN